MHIFSEVFIWSHMRYLLKNTYIYLFDLQFVPTFMLMNSRDWPKVQLHFSSSNEILCQKFDIYLRGFLSSEDVS